MADWSKIREEDGDGGNAEERYNGGDSDVHLGNALRGRGYCLSIAGGAREDYVVRVAGQFRIDGASNPKTEIMCMLAGEMSLVHGQRCLPGCMVFKTEKIVFVGGKVCED